MDVKPLDAVFIAKESCAQSLGVGLLRLVLTLGFELLPGRLVLGYSWERIGAGDLPRCCRQMARLNQPFITKACDSTSRFSSSTMVVTGRAPYPSSTSITGPSLS